jgi:hypothetical protein
MARQIMWAAVALMVAGVVRAQTPDEGADTPAPTGRWRTAERASAAAAESAGPAEPGPPTTTRVARTPKPAEPAQADDPPAAAPRPRTSRARVVTGKGTLPTSDGQVWREYDITPYTSRVTETNRPEQAIVDWVLRETGYEAWHQEPLGFLSANKSTLTVFHTPEMQEVVADVVDRFVNDAAADRAFGLRVITIDNPNWRVRAQRMLKSVPVETQGIQAWLMQTEDAALLMADLRRRTDFREHSSPNLLVANGESTVVSATRAKSYIRDVVLRPGGWPGFETQVGQIDEGFSLELNPLLSLDGTTIDAILKCNIDQVERLMPVVMEVPTPAAPRQRTKIEVPQLCHCRMHERFRWPTDQVLLIGLGVVAAPVPTEPQPFLPIPGANLLPLPGSNSPARVDLLVLVEARGAVAQGPTASRTGGGAVKSYHGRY